MKRMITSTGRRAAQARCLTLESAFGADGIRFGTAVCLLLISLLLMEPIARGVT